MSRRAMTGDVPAWWAGLAAGASRFADPAWLAATTSRHDADRQVWVEATVGQRAAGLRCLLVDARNRSRSTDLIAHLTQRTPYHTPDEADDERRAALRDRVSADDLYPSLVAVVPGLETFLVGAPDAIADADVVDEAIAATLAAAADRAATTCCFLFVQPEDVALSEGLTRAGFQPVKVAVRSNLTVGSSFDAYLAGLSADTRSSIRRTRRRLAATGTAVGIVDPSEPHLASVAALRVAHLERHGHSADQGDELAELRALTRTFPSAVRLFVAERAGSLRGYALVFDDGRVWHAMSTGFSTGADDRDVYFEVMYHAPIEERCASGGGTLSFGYGTEEPKRRRGCEQAVVTAWFRGVAGDGSLPWLATSARSSGEVHVPVGALR